VGLAGRSTAVYRRIVKEYRSDRLAGLPGHPTKLLKDAEEKVAEVQEAWDVLGDPVKRPL